MPRNYISNLLVIGAVGIGAVALLSAPATALAQYKIETYDGHLLDASNRIGSGGYNNSPYNATALNSDDIYLGNVTGYGSFKGNVPDRDPAQFQGYVPLQPSLELQKASGLASPSAAPSYSSQPYYNVYTAPSSPVPLQQIAGTNSYLVAPAPYRAAEDYRLGATLNIPLTTLPGPGELMGVGAVDTRADTTPSFLTSAPLYGISSLDTPASAGPNGEPDSLGTGRALSESSNGNSGLTQLDILRLRTEMNQNLLTPAATSALQNATGTNNNITTTGANSPASPLALPGAPIDAGVSTQAELQPVLVTPGQNGVSTGQTEHQSMALPPPPAEQSAQYAKLKALLEQYQTSHPKSDEEANRLFQQALQARREYEQELSKGPVPVKTSENNTPAPKQQNTQLNQNPTAAPPAPLEVGSIGQGIRYAGLSQLVQQGEDLARHQRFKDAIAKLLEARQVAPNNMLIDVDLANAELGAGFYTEAEQYLRDAFTGDSALLMGRYDLKSEIGDQRLQAVIADLKQLAAGGDSATPVFLLAYLSYNTGDTDKAIEYLHLAQTRAGGQDDVIRLLGEHWSLPATQPSK